MYRDPARLERAVLALDRVVPFVDAPLLLHRAPELLEMDTEELVRRLVKMKWLFPKRDVGFFGDSDARVVDARAGEIGVGGFTVRGERR